MPSRSPTTTNVGGSSNEWSQCAVYAITTTAGFGSLLPPYAATPCDPIAAAILAPAELPQSE